MKNALIGSYLLALLSTLHSNESIPKQLCLNPQDVPIFYENNPLNGLSSFTLITTIPIKIKKEIEKSLATLGDVIHLTNNDMRGFGAGNILLVQTGNVEKWNGTKTDIARLSLSIETSVTLEKTGLKTFPIIWSINTFMQDSSSEESLTEAIGKLLDNFVQNYQCANQHSGKKPVFYVYD